VYRREGVVQWLPESVLGSKYRHANNFSGDMNDISVIALDTSECFSVFSVTIKLLQTVNT